MATIINTAKKNTPAQPKYQGYGKKKKTPTTPLFRIPNYILMGVGIMIAIMGYILLTGGGSDDPNEFSPDIFDTRRLVVAPITILVGLITEIFAIMLRFPDKKETDNQSVEQ